MSDPAPMKNSTDTKRPVNSESPSVCRDNTNSPYLSATSVPAPCGTAAEIAAPSPVARLEPAQSYTASVYTSSRAATLAHWASSTTYHVAERNDGRAMGALTRRTASAPSAAAVTGSKEKEGSLPSEDSSPALSSGTRRLAPSAPAGAPRALTQDT